jgi:hypothetical protein
MVKVGVEEDVIGVTPVAPYYKAQICKRLRSIGIDSKESIPPGLCSLAGRYDSPIWRTGPPGYIGRRNRFLGIDSWAP